jgi:hypothetical protein
MNIKIVFHIMPWEIDYALLTFTQLKKSKYFLSKDDYFSVETVLNLSSYIIDWDKSNLSKEFFIDKYNEISNLLIDYNHIKRTYDGDKLYGHLNLQKELELIMAVTFLEYWTSMTEYGRCGLEKNLVEATRKE